jgi:hypothetical protein
LFPRLSFSWRLGGVAAFLTVISAARRSSSLVVGLALMPLSCGGATPPASRSSTRDQAATIARPLGSSGLEEPSSAYGVHGMVLFGRSQMYASHLPLFRSPHDWQVVLALDPADADVGAADEVRQQVATGRLTTLEPRPFDLLRVSPHAAQPLSQVVGTVYRGHFERGGVPIASGVRFDIRATLVFSRVRPEAPETDAPRWFAFGSGEETYLLHALGPRPEIDTIVAVDGPAPSVPTLVVEPSPRPSEAPPSSAWLARYGWRSPRLFYRETEDLR